MPAARNVLTPEALTMMDVIARSGSFAAAARELGKVPSALTYNVRQLEEALDVLLFDRSSRQARLTAAGEELLHEGRRLLQEMDAVANRVRRVATGWETELTIAVDDILCSSTIYELCEAFYAQRLPPPPGAAGGLPSGPGTRLRLRSEVLVGTWEVLVAGEADLAIGVPGGADRSTIAGVQTRPLGTIDFVFAVAPHHPLAARTAPITDADMLGHRAVAVADSAQRFTPLTVHLLPGQDVLTVPTMQAKLDAQRRGLACGYLPLPMVRADLEVGRLVAVQTERPLPRASLGYAWRGAPGGTSRHGQVGLALAWWLDQLESEATRRALLERPRGTPA